MYTLQTLIVGTCVYDVFLNISPYGICSINDMQILVGQQVSQQRSLNIIPSSMK